MIKLKDNKNWYIKGIRDGVPIALGYFAVAFTLGIIAKKAGITAAQVFVSTATTLSSSGSYAGFTLIAEKSGYIQMALITLVVNARYLLMSFSLSQKLSPTTPLRHRLGIAFGVTDEIFGISMITPQELNPFYNYGAMSVAIPGWATGAALGVIMGNILPPSIVSALSVGLYGMFLAIIIPPARKNKIMAGIVVISMALSFAFSKLPLLCNISSGIRVIILTVVISLACAVLFPVKEEDNEA